MNEDAESSKYKLQCRSCVRETFNLVQCNRGSDEIGRDEALQPSERLRVACGKVFACLPEGVESRSTSVRVINHLRLHSSNDSIDDFDEPGCWLCFHG